MSLINQMLRDLDARRGPTNITETAALQGLGLADGHSDSQHLLLQRTGWAIGLILAGVLIQQGYQIWAKRQPGLQSVVLSTKILPEPSLQSIAPALVSVVVEPPAQQENKLATLPASTIHQPRIIKDVTPAVENPPAPAVVRKKPAHIIKKPLSPTQQAQRHYNRAQGLLTNGQFRAAAKDLRTALELNPELGEARLQLATLYLRLGRPDRAELLLETGYLMNPADTTIATSYIRLLADQGSYQQALELMQARLQQNFVTADTYALSAALYFRADEFEMSASQYRKALAQNPDQAVWRMGLGVSLEHNNETEKALEAYRNVNTAALNSASKTFVRERIYALSGRTE